MREASRPVSNGCPGPLQVGLLETVKGFVGQMNVGLGRRRLLLVPFELWPLHPPLVLRPAVPRREGSETISQLAASTTKRMTNM